MNQCIIDIDVHSISVAKEVVQVAQNFLIGSHKEHSQIVMLALLELMHRQVVRETLIGNEITYLAIAVACDILDCSKFIGALSQPTQRYHREHLVDGP